MSANISNIFVPIYENKFVHVATKKQTYSYHPIFPPAQQLKNYLAGCLKSEPGSILSFTPNSLPDIWDTSSFPYNSPLILFTIFIISLQELIVIYTMVKTQEQLKKVSARICKPLKEPRNRFPARWNWFLGSLNVYKVGLREASGRKEATVYSRLYCRQAYVRQVCVKKAKYRGGAPCQEIYSYLQYNAVRFFKLAYRVAHSLNPKKLRKCTKRGIFEDCNLFITASSAVEMEDKDSERK